MHAIPTMYRGICFRSRLEATWAAFFDLCGRPWQYEPIDLNGYIPDFVLTFTSPLLVEVKPEFTLTGLEKHTAKIDESGWEHDVLLVGTQPFFSDECTTVPGLYRDCWVEAGQWVPDAHLFVHFNEKKERHVGIKTYEGLWTCKNCGEDLHDHKCSTFTCCIELLPTEMRYLFAKAKNNTQWRGTLNPSASLALPC